MPRSRRTGEHSGQEGAGQNRGTWVLHGIWSRCGKRNGQGKLGIVPLSGSGSTREAKSRVREEGPTLTVHPPQDPWPCSHLPLSRPTPHTRMLTMGWVCSRA